MRPTAFPALLAGAILLFASAAGLMLVMAPISLLHPR